MPHRALDLPEPSGPTLADYFGWLRRRWWILVIGVIVGAVAATGLTAIQPRTYTAKTKVLVQSIDLDGDTTSTVKVNLDTEAQVIRSVVVANRVRELMRTADSPERLLAGVTVTVPPNSQVLEVAYAASTPARARDGSHAFAQAYLDLRVDVARRAVDTEIAGIRQQIETVNKQMVDVASRIAVLPANSVDRQRAEADQVVLTNQLKTLNDRLSPLLTAQLVPGSIISDAVLPNRPTSPNRLLNLLSGLGAGLLLGIALALALDRLDTRVRRGRDIAERLGVDMLLEIRSKVNAVGLLPATHRVARELGRLRNVLLTLVPDKEPGVRGRQLLVCATTPGAATGFVVGNLAAAYSRTGAQVVVLTTNLDSPLARVVDGDSAYGLADVLRRDVSALNALTAVSSVPQLRVLLPGDLDPDNELPVAGLLEVLTELAARFDHVLIETSSPTVAAEAQALAGHVDAVLLVAEARRTRNQEITEAVHQFEQVDAAVLGAVLVPGVPALEAETRRGRSPQRGTSGRRSMSVNLPKPGLAPSLPPAGRAAGAAGAGGGAAERGAALANDSAGTADEAVGKARVVRADSTVVLPRITEGKWSSLPRTGTGRDTSGQTNGKPAKPVQITGRRDSTDPE
jgi:polysaccharide biosynthesis transport protein